MSRRPFNATSLLCPCLLIVAGQVCWAQGYQQNTAISWNFSTATSVLGWYPIVALSQFGVQNGALTFTATSTVNIVYSPSFSVPTAPMQLVELVMSSDTAGAAKVFWAPSQTGPYSGFQPGDENDFIMVGDGAFHHYYLPINTSPATTIYQLRVDVPPGATVSIQSVALANLITPTGTGGSPNWSFAAGGSALGWVVYQGVFDMGVGAGGLTLQTYADTTILAPAAIVTNQSEWFSLTGAVTQTSLQTPWFQFNFASTANSGNASSVYVPVIYDSAQHIYNVNVGGASGWFSTVSDFSLTISENTTVAIAQIQIAPAPQGPADVALDACGPATPLIRAGTPFQLSCVVSNRGALPVQGLSVTLNLPSDGSVTIVSSPQVPSSVSNGYSQTLTWTLLASQAETISVSALASAHNESATGTTTMVVNPSVTVTASPYVPAPVPAQSDYDLGIFYFPGWSLDSHWDPIRNFPERMPALGYYAEGSPEVLDWQIKWAVEHGISFFAVDWYWFEAGEPAPQGELPNNFLQAYASAAYRNYIKFCITYADDHAADAAASPAEFLSIVQTWISKYFTQSTYYRFNGMPVVFVVSPLQLDASLGGTTHAALNSARQLAKAAGYGGIYFIAVTNANPVQASQVAPLGYDAISAYSYGTAGAPDPDEASYTSIIPLYENTWASYTSTSTIPYYIGTGTNWDPRPDKPFQFSGQYTSIVTGATPSLYQTMLQAAKARIDAGQNEPVLMVDAWNELGEGHWTEPTAGLGFGYLDAIRSVFVGGSAHTDLTPTDVALPLVETVPSGPLWTFTDSSDLAPWLVSPGPPFWDWTVNVSNSKVSNNQWTFTSNGSPDLVRMGFNLSAVDYSSVAIQMSVSNDTNVTFYWGAVDEPGPSAARNSGFVAHAGTMQTYTLKLAGMTGWRGIIDLARLVMSCPQGTNIAIQSIQFLPANPSSSLVTSRSQMQFTTTFESGRGTRLQSAVISLASLNGSSTPWSATSNASWLSLSSASGTAPANITVSANSAGLSVGVHQATVSIASADGGTAVPVTLWVIPRASLGQAPVRRPR